MFRENVSEVQADCFLKIPTRIGSSAEPSDNTSLSYNYTFFSRTTVYPLVVQP